MLSKLFSKKIYSYAQPLSKMLFSANKVIYLDYQATTPVDYRVVDAMTPYMLQYYGNPHSKTHQYGWDTSKGVEVAR